MHHEQSISFPEKYLPVVRIRAVVLRVYIYLADPLMLLRGAPPDLFIPGGNGYRWSDPFMPK